MLSIAHLAPPLAASALLLGCTTQPLRPIPDPLPETLEWASQGTSAKSFLGLKTRENASDTLDELAFQPGVRVRSVVENSPAEGAGFQVGDIVLSLGEHPTDDPETLARLVQANAPRDEVRLKVQRGDSVFEVPVTLGEGRGHLNERGEGVELLYRKDLMRSRAGWKGGQGGVVLVSSNDDGPFPRAGIEVGSVVLAVEGEAVLSARGLIRKLSEYEPGQRVKVEYGDADGQRAEAYVKLHDEPRRITRVSIPVLTSYGRDLERDSVSFVLIDLWFLSLFRYEREGEEKSYKILRFLQFQSGVGELSE